MIELAAAACAGVTVASLSLLAVRPTRRLGPLVAPYAQRARLLMGQASDPSLLFPPDATVTGRGLVAALVDAGAARLSALVDGGDEAIARRLRHAGHRAMTPEQYRLRMLASTMRGIAAFTGLALLASPSGASVVVAVGLGAVWGASRWRGRIDRAITRRCEQIRAELSTVAHLIAIAVRAGTAPQVAARDLAARGGGAVARELADATGWIEAGTPSRVAWERLASDTAEPAAARLYRLLATSDTGSTDTLADALLKTANDLRSQRREDVERLAIRRRVQMVLPTVALMGPVMILFLAAPIPSVIFGDP